MIELAEQVGMIDPGALLPKGVIVGSAVIEKCVPIHHSSFIVQHYAWHLTDVQRARKLRKPSGHPQPVWFNPF